MANPRRSITLKRGALNDRASQKSFALIIAFKNLCNHLIIGEINNGQL